MASLAGDIESLYEFGPELGRGEFSTVILGTDKKSGEQVAIKIIEKNEMDTSRLETEVMILKKVCNIYRELYTCTCVYIRVRVYV
jgi:serine/threonine protein kinase